MAQAISDQFNTFKHFIIIIIVTSLSPREARKMLPLHVHNTRPEAYMVGSLPITEPAVSARDNAVYCYLEQITTPMQRTALRYSRSFLRPTLSFLRPTTLTIVQLNQQHTRKMSEIKKVYTKNACPRKLYTLLDLTLLSIELY
jgi:hypothetical protein